MGKGKGLHPGTAQGKYEFPPLETGDYVLRLARPLEFKPYRKDSVRIDGQTSLPEIVVDGGIRRATVPLLAQSGADGVVPGSLILGDPNPCAALNWIHAQGVRR